MGFNMYREIPKIKKDLENRNFKKDIHVNELIKTIMVLYGLTKETGINWVKNFEYTEIIKIDPVTEILNFNEDKYKEILKKLNEDSF